MQLLINNERHRPWPPAFDLPWPYSKQMERAQLHQSAAPVAAAAAPPRLGMAYLEAVAVQGRPQNITPAVLLAGRRTSGPPPGRQGAQQLAAGWRGPRVPGWGPEPPSRVAMPIPLPLGTRGPTASRSAARMPPPTRPRPPPPPPPLLWTRKAPTAQRLDPSAGRPWARLLGPH